jgi:hypothetical protein
MRDEGVWTDVMMARGDEGDFYFVGPATRSVRRTSIARRLFFGQHTLLWNDANDGAFCHDNGCFQRMIFKVMTNKIYCVLPHG